MLFSHIPGAQSKILLVDAEDMQVLHGFATAVHAAAYLKSELFNSDVVASLKPFMEAEPDVRIYGVV